MVRNGRKRVLRAELHDGDTLCAEAHGLFVQLNPGKNSGPKLSR